MMGVGEAYVLNIVRVLRFLDVEQLFFKNNLTAPGIDG